LARRGAPLPFIVLLLLALAQAGALALLLSRLWPGRTRRPPVAPGGAVPADVTVSVVVAARNEAARVGPCLHGLAAQGPLVCEILVVDGGSTDGTADLVLAASARDRRVRLLREPPLPPGWVGKVWALQHGLEEARGDWVLGIDADTAPQPGLAAGALSAALREGYDAVSFAPRFHITSMAERWLQPALLTTLVYRFGATGTDADPQRVMANGQCFLARREVLVAGGGYRAARASFCDDVTLARHLAHNGRRVAFLDGSRLYDVRSYSSAREAWREWGRSLDLKDASNPLRQWGDVAFLLLVQGVPLPALLLAAVGTVTGHALGGTASLVTLLSAIMLGVRLLLLPALAPSYVMTGLAFWLSPLADPLAALRILLSTLRTPTQWRGRVYAPSYHAP
jgi:dolichol-phosphate mannosyltransferase